MTERLEIVARPLSIYVAGPLSNNETWSHTTQWQNMLNAIEAGAELKEKGHYPFVPHYSYMMTNMGHHFTYGDWLEEDFVWIEKCEALYRMEGDSAGADLELKHARNLGKIIFLGMEEVPDLRNR